MRKSIIATLILQHLLSGCAWSSLPIIAGVVTLALDERSMGTIIDDKIIATTINTEFSHNSNMFFSINVSVLEGRVLLTGSVTSKEYADKAVKIAWSTRGVLEVINEIIITTKEIKTSANDMLIEKSIDSKLLVEKNLISINYKVVVNHSIVFILGIAQNQNEMDRALEIARNTQGVNKVINYIILKNDLRRWQK